ncbi:hypothetical protein B484DRAFT_319196, partial [Ochromonadaceae sp. CCMP2298]
LICWDGGALNCCDHCPASYHLQCLGITPKMFKKSQTTHLWSCPHHSCSVCDRKAAAVGGLLFRCTQCSSAFCEEDLPPAAVMVGRCL